MNFKKQNGYIIISEFNSLKQIYEKKSELDELTHLASVFVFIPDSQCETGETEAEKLKIASFFNEIPVIMVLASENMQAYSPDFIMLFDVRLGCHEYMIDKNTEPDERFMERYEILCGTMETYRYKCFLSSSDNEKYASGLVRLLPDDIPFTEALDQYLEKVLGGKTDFQTAAIASCLAAARNGNGNAVLEEESCQFYRLMRKKSEEITDGNE